MKPKYPYDPQKAADYAKQQLEEEKLRRAQNAGSVRTSLLAKEAQLRSRIEKLENEKKYLRRDIEIQGKRAKGKKVNHPDRVKVDQLRRQLLQLRDETQRLKDELERTEILRHKYE